MACSLQAERIASCFFVVSLLVFSGILNATSDTLDTGTYIETTSAEKYYQKPRRFLRPWVCRGGPGPACLEGMQVKCKVGGNRGCMCALLKICHPEVSGCFMHYRQNISSCGF